MVGAGLAGLSAAYRAASRHPDLRVLLLAKGALCSGSSFYTLNDTLHCLCPETAEEQRNFLEDANRNADGQNDPFFYRYYATHIKEATDLFQAIGVQASPLPDKKLACFAQHLQPLLAWSDWPATRERATRKLRTFNNLEFVSGVDLAALVTDGAEHPTLEGIVAEDPKSGTFYRIGCGALILATGGFGNLYRYHLNSPEVNGDGQSLLLSAGGRLVNLEFNQFIPGLLSPVSHIVFREFTLDYCDGLGEPGADPLRERLPNPEDVKRCLHIRASHGPFTSSLFSKHFDLALMEAIAEHPEDPGVRIRYNPQLYDDKRSFVRHYLIWLEERFNIRLDRDRVTLAPFFHAANGGILVNHDMMSDIAGVFACGEAAGGLHGADRIGGIMTGGCLVFGALAADRAAAQAGNAHVTVPSEDRALEALRQTYGASQGPVADPASLQKEMQEILWQTTNVLRNEKDLTDAANRLRALSEQDTPLAHGDPPERQHKALEVSRALKLALAIVTAERERRESRGAHYREDYPEPEEGQGPRTVRLNGPDYLSEPLIFK